MIGQQGVFNRRPGVIQPRRTRTAPFVRLTLLVAMLGGELAAPVGRLRYLGKRYHLAAGNRAAFHPKVLLRVGPSGAYLWLGSGNITHGGWGVNHELSMAMKLDSDDAESRSLVAGLLDQIIKYCGSDNVVDALRRISDRSWITGITGGKIVSPVLLSTPDRSLGSDLAERWSGRRFTSLRVFTGSTDRVMSSTCPRSWVPLMLFDNSLRSLLELPGVATPAARAAQPPGCGDPPAGAKNPRHAY